MPDRILVFKARDCPQGVSRGSNFDRICHNEPKATTKLDICRKFREIGSKDP